MTTNPPTKTQIAIAAKKLGTPKTKTSHIATTAPWPTAQSANINSEGSQTAKKTVLATFVKYVTGNSIYVSC